jgi:dienelactone hydrolase
MRSAVAAVALALALVSAGAGADYRNPTVGRVVALQIPGMHLAKVRRNQVYRPYLRLDVYRPAAARGPLPAVLFLHGTARDESPKDSGQFVGWGQLAAASGLVGVTLNHMQDPAETAAAIRYVRRNAARLGIDGSRVCLAGYSAGVQAAMLTALAPANRVRCAVAYYGPLDTELRDVSPRTYLRRDSPPVLVAMAARDNPALNNSMYRFIATARRLDARVELVVHGTGGHGFDVSSGDARARAIIRRTLDFLRVHLRAR